MDDILTRFTDNLIGRLHGPLTFRLILQPLMAAIFACRDGLADARQGRPAYSWAVFTERGERRALLSEGWKAVGRIVVLGVVMDLVYQLIEFRWVYPTELLVVVFILALLPYLILRGPINRLARIWIGSRKEST